MAHICKCRRGEFPVGYLPDRHDKRWATHAKEISYVRSLFT